MALAQEIIALSRIEKQGRGYLQLSLTNFANLLEPEIAAGSRAEVGDALFYAAGNEAITGWAGIGNSTDAYIKLVPAGLTPDTCTAVFTDVAPTWSDTKQGFYGVGANANHRYIGGLYKDAAGDYTEKWLYTMRPNGVLIVCDEKAAGTEGGTFTTGAWRTRTLNTIRAHGIPGASLAADQITLPAGVYYADFSAPAGVVGHHQTRLRDITNGLTLVVGTTEYSWTTDSTWTRSIGRGRFFLSAAAVIELQHNCSVTKAANGMGNAANLGEVEVYAEIKIHKVQ